jgi:hypothetical protein
MISQLRRISACWARPSSQGKGNEIKHFGEFSVALGPIMGPHVSKVGCKMRVRYIRLFSPWPGVP